MADKGPLWERMVRKHGLRDYPYSQIVAWGFGDFVFASDYDIASDTGKARRLGFTECMDSEEMFIRLFGEFRAQRIIP